MIVIADAASNVAPHAMHEGWIAQIKIHRRPYVVELAGDVEAPDLESQATREIAGPEEIRKRFRLPTSRWMQQME